MEIGVCMDISKASEAKEAGFDYIELPLNKVGLYSDEEFGERLAEFKKVGIPAPSCSLLLPKTMMLIDRDLDYDALDKYLEAAFSRMEALGASVVSFGSGKSRRVPEGMPYAEAYKILVEATKHMVDVAKMHGVTIAIEPLNRGETNLINLLSEGSALSAMTGASLLADAYHMRRENEPMSDVPLCQPIAHAHIATLDGRRYPTEMTDEVLEFARELKKANFNGRLSVEGKTEDFPSDAKKAIRVLKRAFEEA